MIGFPTHNPAPDATGWGLRPNWSKWVTASSSPGELKSQLSLTKSRPQAREGHAWAGWGARLQTLCVFEEVQSSPRPKVLSSPEAVNALGFSSQRVDFFVGGGYL